MSFQYIKPTDEQVALMQGFRDKYEALVTELKEKVTASRGLSLAVTKLEESAFWLNKSITHNDN
jgi:hypothetical protein